MAIKIKTGEGTVIEFDTVEEFTEFQQASGVVGGEDAVGCVDEMGDEDKPKFKVGDKVRVVSADDGTDTKFHHVPIGEVVTVTSVVSNLVDVDYSRQTLLTKHVEKVDEDTTPKIEVGDKVRIVNDEEDAGYYHSHNVEVPGRADQYLAAKDIEKVESVGKDANGDDLYVGDLVTGIEDDEALMEVVEGTAGGYIRVEGQRLQIDDFETYGDRSVVGVDFWVLPERFVKTTEEEFTSRRPQFDDGDIVIVTQHITNSDGDVASTGTVGIIDNLPIVGSCFIDVGGVMVRVYGRRSGDDHLHKLTLVCKAEDRLDR